MLTAYLLSNPSVIRVHETCRKGFVYIPSDQVKRASDSDLNDGTNGNKFLCSYSDKFEWKTNCFLCAKPANKCIDIVYEAKPDRLTETMLRICSERQDAWGFEVRGRIETCGDLHAADVYIYHKNCHRKFSSSSSVRSSGRPIQQDSFEAFK